MNRDIEIFNNLIMNTETLKRLQIKATENAKSLEQLLEVAEILENINEQEEYKNIKNNIIYEALKEVRKNKRFMKFLKENTNINLDN